MGDIHKMSREVKFRGKRIANGKWVTGSLLFNPSTDEVSIVEFVGGIPRHYRVYGETVGEYTGLNNERDVEFYEGDIVDLNGGHSPVRIYWRDGGFGYLSPVNGEYWVGPRIGYATEGLKEILEVATLIGNIHDNPELLKVKP